MTDAFDGRVDQVAAELAGYVAPTAPIKTAIPALAKLLLEQEQLLEKSDLERMCLDLLAAREASTTSRLHEAITALIARSILREALSGLMPADETNVWLRRHITAQSRHAETVTAIWRATTGLGDDADAKTFAQALSAAQQGQPITPVPGAAPPKPGTEDTMIDPEKIRTMILDKFAINPAGLPTRLRSEEGQNVFLDFVAKGVSLQLDFDENDTEKAMLWSAAVAGILLVDGLYQHGDQRFFTQIQRALVELGGGADEDGQIVIGAHTDKMFASSASQRIKLFARTAEAISKVKQGRIFLQSVTVVSRMLADRFDDVKDDETVLNTTAETAYNADIADTASNGGGGGRNGGIANLELPPLNDPAGYNDEIEPDNIRAVSTIYVTYQLEFGLKAAARILDLFVAGLLPISASDGSARELDNLYWDQEDLLDEGTRRSIYARVLGAAGGEIGFGIQPNTEFNNLLLRVVSAVSEFEREQSALTHFDNASRGRRFQTTSGEFVRKAIRDFAANASLRGWAGTAFSAERMAKQVRRVMRILSLPSVKNAFGVSTPWQVIERVSQREFGITVNTVLQRTLALETQKIMQIIADHHTIWSSGTGQPLFPDGIGKNSDLSVQETLDLMTACQHFRAVTGFGDTMLDEYSDPVQSAAMPSLPDLGSMGGPSGAGGGGMGIDTAAIGQLKSMVSNGQTPSLDQLRAMLPGF